LPRPIHTITPSFETTDLRISNSLLRQELTILRRKYNRLVAILEPMSSNLTEGLDALNAAILDSVDLSSMQMSPVGKCCRDLDSLLNSVSASK
jgi:hypothetical protein